MGIRNKDLEDMEALILHHLSLVSEKIHAYFQMLSSVNIGRHYGIIRPVQKNFAEKLY